MNKQDLLMRAVYAQQNIPDRSEYQNEEELQFLFVNNPRHNIATTMTGRRHQILFGRRGTGKTTLFKQLLLDGMPHNPAGQYIAIMIQAQDFMRSPEVLQKDPVVVRARSYFREFLGQVAEQMIAVGDKTLKNESLLSKLGLKNKPRRDVLVDRLFKLHAILKHGIPYRRLVQSSYQEELTNVTSSGKIKSTESGGGIGASVDVGLGGNDTSPIVANTDLQFDSKVSGYGKSVSEKRQSENMTATIQSGYDLGVPEIRNLFRDIVETLQLDHIMILLDEWESLNDCQAEFAQYLKSTFMGIQCISIKIAAYRNVCKFNNGATRANFRGFEVGQDISEAGDTDLPPSGPNTKKFFFDILYKRLLYKERELETIYGPPDAFDHLLLAADVCKNQYAADMLVRGAHGISRDFLTAFYLAACTVNYDVARDKITLESVNDAHGELSRKIQENVHTADDIGGLLYELVKPHVHRTGAPFFFIGRQNEEWDELLWELVEKRALHVIPSADMPEGSDVEWKGYEISYGLFEEWSRALMFANREAKRRLTWRDIKDLNRSEFDRFVLQLEGVPRGMKMCNSCKHQFSTAERPYIVARLCPVCYVKQEE